MTRVAVRIGLLSPLEPEYFLDCVLSAIYWVPVSFRTTQHTSAMKEIRMQVPALPNTAVMTSPASLRPEAFNEPYIVTDHLAYLFVEASGGPSSSGGVLRKGQTAWLEAVVQRTELQSFIRAFVESVGVIVVDPRWLRRGETTLAPQRRLALRQVERKQLNARQKNRPQQAQAADDDTRARQSS